MTRLHDPAPHSISRFAALLFFFLLFTTSGYPAEERQNVLFIAVDDLRPELSVYGKPVVTPNIERLADAGTVFEHAYVQEALCMPSRASILTGRRPDTTGVVDFTVGFRSVIPEVVTLPEHFKNHGYHARGFGKIFHNDDPQSWSAPHWRPRRDEYHTEHGKQILKWIKDDYRKLTFTWDLGDGITKTKRPGGPPWEAPDVPDNALRDGHTTDVAIETLGQLADEPFFLAVGFDKPHLPFVAPKKYFDLYDRESIALATNPFPPKDTPDFAVYNFNDMRHYYGVPKIGPVPDEMARDLKHAYYACVSYVDSLIGRLLDELDRLDLRDNTIVLLWGDHGWQLGEHGIWDKHTNFETSVRAPLIISVPGQTPGRSAGLVEFVDIYPSLAELCHLPLDEGLEGTSFLPLIEDPDREWKPAAFSQYPRVIPGYGNIARGMGYSMRTDRYRFTEWTVPGTEFLALELYDHRNDPDENTNIANHPENEELIKILTARLHAGWKAARPALR